VLYLTLHANWGSEATEEEPAGLQDPPRSVQHGLEVHIVARKMEDGVADNHVRARIVEGHPFDGFDWEIWFGKSGREHPGEGTDALHRLNVWVNGINLVSFPQEINEVSAGTASGVQDSHSGWDAAFQKLVEKIDVDLPNCSCIVGTGILQT
jgi:hypothetical protein